MKSSKVNLLPTNHLLIPLQQLEVILCEALDACMVRSFSIKFWSDWCVQGGRTFGHFSRFLKKKTVYRRFVVSFRLIYSLARMFVVLTICLRIQFQFFRRCQSDRCCQGLKTLKNLLLQKVPRRFVFSLFSIKNKFLNIYSLAAIFLVTIVCNIIRFWLKHIEVRYINCGTVVRETLGLEIYCVIRVRTFPLTTIIRI